MIFAIVCAIIGIFLLVFIGYDLVAGLYVWEKRIHIGRWTDINEWERNIFDIVKKWLIHPPVVKKTDQNRYLLWDKLRGEYKVNTIQQWQKAGLLWGVGVMCDKHAVNSFLVENFNLHQGVWRKNPQNIDAGLLGYVTLLFADELEKQKLRPAMDYLYRLILSHEDKGTIYYRKQLPYVRFVDTLGLVCPFLILYGITYNVKDAVNLSIAQFKEYDEALLSNALPCHAFDMERKLPLGVHDWGRGCGWYILALVELYRIIEQFNLSETLQQDLQTRILRLADVMLSFQLPQGGYGAMLFNRNSFSESSITVLSGLLMHQAWIFTKGDNYRQCLEKCLRQLMKVTQRDGCIDYCQGDTKGIGFYSSTFSYMPFVQGMAVVLLRRYKQEYENA